MEGQYLNSHQQHLLYDTLISNAMEAREYLLFSTLKPKINKDGNQWCVLYGDDIQSGIAGFGETPYKAIIDFNLQWNR